MAHSRDLSRYHTVTLGTKSVKVLPRPRPEDEQPSGVFGPYGLSGFLFCSGDQRANPGRQLWLIFLSGLPLLRTPWTVTAAVTELSPPSTPWQGDALFETLGVMLQQSSEFGPYIMVDFNLEWDSPLPIAVMATIGYT